MLVSPGIRAVSRTSKPCRWFNGEPASLAELSAEAHSRTVRARRSRFAIASTSTRSCKNR